MGSINNYMKMHEAFKAVNKVGKTDPVESARMMLAIMHEDAFGC